MHDPLIIDWPVATYSLNESPVDLVQFLADNDESLTDDELQLIDAMAPGDCLKFGGGAAPIYILKRCS